jgi:hypothetical protein
MMALSRGESSIPVARSKSSELDSGRSTEGDCVLGPDAEAGAGGVATGADSAHPTPLAPSQGRRDVLREQLCLDDRGVRLP